MTQVLAVTTIVDCLAVLALAWLVRRGRRAHELVAAEQQATLERLRAELADLVADAERRAAALDESLARREAALRELVRAAEPMRPMIDPAEVRLRRDLELRLGAGATSR